MQIEHANGILHASPGSVVLITSLNGICQTVIITLTRVMKLKILVLVNEIVYFINNF